MEKVKTIYKLTDEEVKSAPFVRAKTDEEDLTFYPLIRKLLDKPEETIDCRKICVANNITQYWLDYAEEHGIPAFEIGMMIVCSAPKSDESLRDNEICIEEGCFTAGEEEQLC